MAGLILYNNILRGATVVSEDTLTNFPIANALDGKLVTQVGFSPDADRDIIFDLGVTTTFDTIAMARHGFADLSNVDFSVWGSSDNVSYTNLSGVLNVASNDVYVNTFSSSSYRYVRLRFNSTVISAFVSDIFVGAKLDLERSQKYGFIKPEFADNDTIRQNITRGQNLAGIEVERKVKSVSFTLDYYTDSFFNANWEDLALTMKSYPIYIKWDTSEKVFYCWPSKSIPQPRYSANTNNYYSVKLDMQGVIL